MDGVDRIQSLLGVELDEQDQARVAIYIKQAQEAITTYIGKYLADDEPFPSQLNYIVDALVLGKYNQFHNEGMTSIAEEGLTINFGQGIKDYLPDLQAWADQHEADEPGDIVGW